MSIGVVVSFLCAVFNRTFGAKRVALTAVVTLAFIVGWYLLKSNGWAKTALLSEALAAGALYALAAGVIERTTGRRIVSSLAEQVTFVMVPPLGLIFLVLGTIFIGLATPTEGGAMGAAGAIILAMMKRRMTFDLTRQAVESTAKLSAFVLFILVGARVFSLTFYGVSGHVWVEHLLTSLPGGQTGFLIIVNIMIFVLAFFLDFFELAFIAVPLIGPAADKLGIDLIWFGVILGVNMQTSFMHPPFGFALFYLRSVAAEGALQGQGHGQDDGAGHDRADLLGRRAVRGHPVHHGGAGRDFPADGDALQEQRARRRQGEGDGAAQQPRTGDRPSAARFRAAEDPVDATQRYEKGRRLLRPFLLARTPWVIEDRPADWMPMVGKGAAESGTWSSRQEAIRLVSARGRELGDSPACDPGKPHPAYFRHSH